MSKILGFDGRFPPSYLSRAWGGPKHKWLKFFLLVSLFGAKLWDVTSRRSADWLAFVGTSLGVDKLYCSRAYAVVAVKPAGGPGPSRFKMARGKCSFVSSFFSTSQLTKIHHHAAEETRRLGFRPAHHSRSLHRPGNGCLTKRCRDLQQNYSSGCPKGSKRGRIAACGEAVIAQYASPSASFQRSRSLFQIDRDSVQWNTISGMGLGTNHGGTKGKKAV